MPALKLERAIQTLIGLLLAVFVYVIFDSFHERLVEVGDSAPDFSITTDNGRTITNSNFGGKLLVLNFWATWCPPCVEETPSLSRFAAQYQDKGVVVLAVSVDRDEKAYRKFLDKYRPAFLTAREDKVHADYGTFMYPETYIIDASGKVLRKYAEPVDFMSQENLSFINSAL